MRRPMNVFRTMVLVCVMLGLLAGQARGGTPTAEAAQPALPLSEVVLYASGVGYFQRDGVVDGRQSVALRFRTDQVNDLLKSMIVQDFDGGRVATVTYDSRDPVTKTLKSFAVDLTTNPSLGQLLERIRGERVEVATPSPLQGIILGVERKQERAGEKEVVEVEYLNLVTADGLRSIPLAQIQRLQILNERLSAELRQALEVLASAHDTQQKVVRLAFDGSGRRRVRVAYVAEAPVWKTSYRLVLSEAGRPYLQGWAVVENTTDEDWENVKLSLVSGRPISFIMDLYEPLYAKRPQVVSELYQALRPQVYEQPMEEARDQVREAPRSRLMQEAPAAKAAPRLAAPAPALMPSAAGGAPAEVQLQRGVAASAQAAEAGELFQYAIQAPVSLGRHKSALLPIVGQEVEGAKLSIYNERTHAKHPFSGFRLQNVTSLHLSQGPLTVFDGGIYAGDARLADLAPGQERLVSYALDLKTEVEPQGAPGAETLVTASLRKGTLLVTRKLQQSRIYNVKNRDTKKKAVLIEHPFRSDWTLAEPVAASERTREVYRFAVPVDAGASARLTVREERQVQQTVRLVDSGPDTIGYYLQAKEVSAKVKEALQRVVALRDRLDQTANRRGQLEKRAEEIAKEQGRIRENMARLAQTSELYARYVGKLNEQETEIERLRKEIEAQRTAEERQKRELNDYLLGLDLE